MHKNDSDKQSRIRSPDVQNSEQEPPPDRSYVAERKRKTKEFILVRPKTIEEQEEISDESLEAYLAEHKPEEIEPTIQEEEEETEEAETRYRSPRS